MKKYKDMKTEEIKILAKLPVDQIKKKRIILKRKALMLLFY